MNKPIVYQPAATDYNFTSHDFADWLAKNRVHFRQDGYNSLEVSDLAEMVGFTRKVIVEGLSHFQDAIAGSSFDRRADFQIKANMREIDAHCDKPSLLPQWSALAAKLLYDRDFDDEFGGAR